MGRQLRSQLTSICYDFRNGKILIEPKDKIKERLGRSPDEADCYVMGVWAVKRAMPEIQFNNFDKYKSPYDNNVLTRGLGLRRRPNTSQVYDNNVLTRGLKIRR